MNSKPSEDSLNSTGKKTDLDYWLDLYWGGPERRITTLTLRIISVNIVALIMLAVGIFFMGEYHEDLVEIKLKAFKEKADIVSAAVAETFTINQNKAEKFTNDYTIQTIKRLSQVMQQRIMLFDGHGNLIADSLALGPHGLEGRFFETKKKKHLQSTKILRKIGAYVLDAVRKSDGLPLYPQVYSIRAQNYPDADKALEGTASMSAWYDQDEDIFLSTAVPILNGKKVLSVILLTRKAPDIKQDINNVWITIVQAFFITFIVTVLLSIYLSGVITSPLKKLARAAENIRKGKLNYIEIPDFSDRRDEIGDLSIALRQMTETINEHMNSIESFAADVAHELKNPLTSLQSAVETLSVVKKKTDRDKLMQIIKHDLERLNRLITDISHASRLDTELSRGILQPFNLQNILSDVLDTFKDPLSRTDSNDEGEWNKTVNVQDKDITIKLSSSEKNDVFVLAFEGRLNQVFENILSNAVSFSKAGSSIHIRVHSRKTDIKITIDDQGPGIPEKKLEAVFDRFYSQRPDHEAYGQHSGLGLSICKQIIDAMNGQIFTENILDLNGTVKGARFTIILRRGR